MNNRLAGESGDRSVISVDQLRKTYRNGWFRHRFEALRGISFDVRAGEVFGLLGPNGAGKTTFLKILLGILRKSGGHATMLGYPAGDRRGRRRVGFLPEQLRIPGHLTGHTALDYFGRLGGMSAAAIRRRRGDLLEFVGLGGRGGDRTSKYSKGMLQRLGLALALLHQPDLLVLDEPTDGLDPAARAEMRHLMSRLRSEGVTIFLNSHLLQEVEMVCDRVAILDLGELRYCGPVREIGSFLGGGPASGVQVQMKLSGDVETCRKILVEGAAAGTAVPEVSGTSPVSEGEVLFTVRFASQGDLDAAIDRLREANISLIELVRDSMSLEEGFLQITGRPLAGIDSAPPSAKRVPQ